jgi:hypothetical protein
MDIAIGITLLILTSCSNESLFFVAISLVMNVICFITLASSLLRGCRRWDGEELEERMSWYDSEKAVKSHKIQRR